MVRTENEQLAARSQDQAARPYWSSLLSGRMMPGLGLAASRLKPVPARPIVAPKVTGRLSLPPENPATTSR
jgi:hypothetical protein